MNSFCRSTENLGNPCREIIGASLYSTTPSNSVNSSTSWTNVRWGTQGSHRIPQTVFSSLITPQPGIYLVGGQARLFTNTAGSGTRPRDVIINWATFFGSGQLSGERVQPHGDGDSIPSAAWMGYLGILHVFSLAHYIEDVTTTTVEADGIDGHLYMVRLGRVAP